MQHADFSSCVMAGLVPAIHKAGRSDKELAERDARNKSGHDVGFMRFFETGH